MIGRDRLWELVRYYQAGVLNTAFGFSFYSLLVWLGVNLFVAQLVAHLAGMAFNYLTFTRHVFRGAVPSLRRYVLSYAGNYVVGLAGLALAHHFIPSPYLAALASLVVISAVNYLVLKRFVFRTAG